MFCAGSGIILPNDNNPIHDRFCSLLHDTYRVKGPDGRYYATWHPPSVTVFGIVTCHFGHEHGDDPRLSLVNSTLPPFDYVNFLAGRSEAHVGFKVFVVNDDSRGGRFRIVVHQGSSSKNAYAENRHELFVDYVNADGRELHAMLLGHFGPSGKFKVGCEDRSRQIEVAPPKNEVTEGERIIPDTGCFAEGRIPYELWGASNEIKTPDGRSLATFRPYFTILNPNRVYAAGNPDGIARSDVEASSGQLPAGKISRYKGTQREVYENEFQFDNNGGKTAVWTDADGHVQPGPCPTCIQQYICAATVHKAEPAIIFRTVRDYDDGTVHAPN
jgi:hypothetical protein